MVGCDFLGNKRGALFLSFSSTDFNTIARLRIMAIKSFLASGFFFDSFGPRAPTFFNFPVEHNEGCEKNYAHLENKNN